MQSTLQRLLRLDSDIERPLSSDCLCGGLWPSLCENAARRRSSLDQRNMAGVRARMLNGRSSAPICAAFGTLVRRQGMDGMRERSRARQFHRLHRLGYAQDAHHALEVVCQGVQAHLSADVGEEVGRTHPVLERTEDVLDGAPS